jgi:hypothetical protein
MTVFTFNRIIGFVLMLLLIYFALKTFGVLAP